MNLSLTVPFKSTLTHPRGELTRLYHQARENVARLVCFQLISPNVCYPVYPGGQDGTTSETPASYAK